MKSVCNLVLAVSVLALGGCTMYDTYSEVDALNEAHPVGSPFTQSLAGEYKTFANEQLDKRRRRYGQPEGLPVLDDHRP